MLTFYVVIIAMSGLVQCQRGSFAGTGPIGFPELLNRTTTTVDPLGNRFGEGDSTTERLPIEANGDRDLVDRISKWPIDKQPFWYLNWRALEEQRKNPQTYPQRPSQFAENPNFNAPNGNAAKNTNSGTLNSNSGTPNSNSGTPNSNSGTPNSNSGTLNSNSGTLNSNSGTLHSKSGTGNPDAGTRSTNNAAINPTSGVPSLGNRNGVIETNSNIGNKRPMNTEFHGSNFGHNPHNRYGT